MSKQFILTASENYKELDQYLIENKVKKIFLVCGKSIESLRLYEYFQSLASRLGIRYVRFSGFKPNPLYESVVEGTKLFRKENCDLIVAVGGGSAMDGAKALAALITAPLPAAEYFYCHEAWCPAVGDLYQRIDYGYRRHDRRHDCS